MNAHVPNGTCTLFYGSVFVEKHMRTWAVELILVENIHTRIKEFEVSERIVLLVSRFYSTHHKSFSYYHYFECGSKHIDP